MPATDRELRTNQKTLLIKLYRIQRELDGKGLKVDSFDELLKESKAGMDGDDIAWVEKILDE